MSYLKTIQKARIRNDKAVARVDRPVHQGGIDVLVGSPPPGDPEPLWQMLKPDQLNSDAAKVYLKWLREHKRPGDDTGWAWSFDRERKWHQIDDEGTVCAPLNHVPCLDTCVRPSHTSARITARYAQAGRLAG